MRLSILICHLPEREHFLKRLMNILQPQVTDGVEILVDDTGREMPTGTKRNKLIAQATGEYFSFIDVDDLVPMFYVNEILKAIEQKPDCVTFIGYMTTNGADRRNFVIKLGEKYEERDRVYYRPPNHLAVIKKELVKNIRFRDIWQLEDYHYCMDMQRLNLLKSEVHINCDMYHYDFQSNKHKTKHAKSNIIR